MNVKSQSGNVSRTLIILAIVVFFAILIVYLGIKYAATKREQTYQAQQSSQTNNELPKPVYETKIGDTRFVFETALNLGNLLKGKSGVQQDLSTTEKFIEVVVGAQNKGKTEIPQYMWDLGYIIDSEGHKFVSVNNKAFYWIPKPDLCGSLLKPEFFPIPCVKIYEVSKKSTSLKVQVNATLPNSTKKQESFLDLNVK